MTKARASFTRENTYPQVFLISSAAGVAALALNFFLRIANLAPFPPESALESILRVIPESIQEPSVQALGDFAGQLGVLIASVLAVVIYGIMGLFFFMSVLPKMYRASRSISVFESLLLYSLFPFVLFGVITVALSGDSIFGLSSPFASSDSVFFFPASLLLVQLFYGALLYFGLDRMRYIQRITQTLAPNRITLGSKRIQHADSTSRRIFLQKAALGAGVLLLAAYGLERILSSSAPAGPQPISGQSSGIDLQDAPAIFSDPRLAALVNYEVTPNDSFYRVAIDIFDPQIDSSSWSLKVTGSVGNPSTSYTLDELQNSFAPAEEYNTFECVSNEINGGLIGNAKWTGVKISDVLGGSGGPTSSAKYAVFYSVDGYSVALPLSKALQADSILAYMMNGQPLPQKHGYPLRAVIPGLYGMMSAKWINRIDLADSPYEGYWQTRGWSPSGVVQTVAFITVPASKSISLSGNGGSVLIGGTAYAGDRGISKVEVSLDSGNTWQVANLKTPLSNDTWALWAYEWTPTKTGAYNVYARATDGTGTVQASQPTDTFPNGATGYAMTEITVNS